jgi:hypothetical protein
MKIITILATLALVISPSLAFGMEPAKHATQQTASNGTRQNSNQYHDRTPVLHDRGQVTTR